MLRSGGSWASGSSLGESRGRYLRRTQSDGSSRYSSYSSAFMYLASTNWNDLSAGRWTPGRRTRFHCSASNMPAGKMNSGPA